MLWMKELERGSLSRPLKAKQLQHVSLIPDTAFWDFMLPLLGFSLVLFWYFLAILTFISLRVIIFTWCHCYIGISEINNSEETRYLINQGGKL